ncbi:TetR/AcrR family transcriptional regulator [Marilutibacter alkalisoli]|uniref:TetR/AcrR family transcriptional regulator n=1 Tax=Marilutibacter alkalisoli TaxID=2591633 RepID=A0A514BMZ6_9GAMM|nr:TetR/AcrR family transcriptional regulator [Lysobacter alkalisoli]QDH68764.1 TetR/AcrR family transcriptional regulator [Lysobacter alkalisoli]
MSTTPPGKRSYAKRKRQESQDETRQRIVEASMHLHEEIGPRATTISAIAQRAGVTRLTVYRHFPDETAVFQACTSHWLSLNPPPAPSAWAGVTDPYQRADAAIAAFHRYYASTTAMWMAAHRDVADVPALQGPMAEFSALVDEIADDLFRQFKVRRHRVQLQATLRHVLAFTTWASLQRLGLDDPGKTKLARAWIAAVT